MTEDLAPFFVDFGITATVGGTAVRAIFDNGYATALGFTAGTAPMLVCRASDVSGASIGTAVTASTISYTVAAIEPDGTGLVVLRLEAA